MNDMSQVKSELPSVAGRMEMTHEQFQWSCQVALRDLQENPNCDTHLVALLCEAVRCSRECCEIATINLGARVQRLDSMSEATTLQSQLTQVTAECNLIKGELALALDHENDTHDRLTAILGNDDSLENCAKRMKSQLTQAQARIDALVEDGAKSAAAADDAESRLTQAQEKIKGYEKQWLDMDFTICQGLKLLDIAHKERDEAVARLKEAEWLLGNVNQGKDWYERRDAWLKGGDR